MSNRSNENQILLEHVEAVRANSDAVMGSPRTWEELRYGNESFSKSRGTRLMRFHTL